MPQQAVLRYPTLDHSEAAQLFRPGSQEALLEQREQPLIPLPTRTRLRALQEFAQRRLATQGHSDTQQCVFLRALFPTSRCLWWHTRSCVFLAVLITSGSRIPMAVGTSAKAS